MPEPRVPTQDPQAPLYLRIYILLFEQSLSFISRDLSWCRAPFNSHVIPVSSLDTPLFFDICCRPAIDRWLQRLCPPDSRSLACARLLNRSRQWQRDVQQGTLPRPHDRTAHPLLTLILGLRHLQPPRKARHP